MTYSIIGTGNVAWFLARRLKMGGHECTGIYGRNSTATEELARSIAAIAYPIDQIKDGDADICFLAVADAAIPEVAAQLSFEKTVLVHTAGSVDVVVIANAATDTGVLWPIYSILRNSLPEHRNIPCAWEATTDQAKRYLLAIAHSFTDVLFEAAGQKRQWMHLMAVVGNNFTNHLLAICEQIGNEQQIPFSTFLPIIEQTFNRIQRSSPADIQTGPARRGDSATIARHTDMLAQNSEWQRVYAAISASIEKMYAVKDTTKDLND